MAALLETPTTTDAFSNTLGGLPPTLNPLSVSQSDKDSLTQTFCEQKAKPEKDLLANPEYKPRLQPARKTRRSLKPYVSREDVGPERARHLERNRVAAKKFRLKKNKEHEQTQSVLECETAKRETLWAQVNGLKEEVWHLKNQMFEHATKCDAQQVNLQLALMTQNVLRADTDAMQCPSPTFSVSTWSDESVGDGDGGRIEPGALEDAADAAHGVYPDGLFDSFIDVPNV